MWGFNFSPDLSVPTLQAIRKAIGKDKLLTVAVPAIVNVDIGYNVPEISKVIRKTKLYVSLDSCGIFLEINSFIKGDYNIYNFRLLVNRIDFFKISIAP